MQIHFICPYCNINGAKAFKNCCTKNVGIRARYFPNPLRIEFMCCVCEFNMADLKKIQKFK